MRRRRLFWLFFSLAVVLGLVVCTDVLARAGGGGSYSGGGGGGFSGGGSSGGGSGEGIAIFLLVRAWFIFCIHYPYIGLPVTGVIIFVLIKYGKHVQVGQQGRTIARGRKIQAVSEQQAAVAQIQQRDPEFSESKFFERISRAFVLLQDAWSKQNLVTAAAFISDGIAERFMLQFEEQKAQGYRNQMDDVQVTNMRIAQIESDDVFDTVTVEITASAKDYNVTLADGKSQSHGAVLASSFTEYWSFVRRPGAKSLAGDGLIEGNCPNCGAALALNEVGKCEACGALVRSGQYDWVLAEITQACEWVAQPTRAIPGLVALKAKDPGFSRQNLEDRASVIFWRYVKAQQQGRAEAIQKMAMQSFCTQLEEQMRPGPNGERSIFSDCAVGAVETEGILHGDDMDRAVVGVRWSGARYTVLPGKEPRKTAESHVVYDLFVLARKHGVKTDLALTLSSAHCPTCGAAIHDQVADACEYCGAVLNDGSAGWVLEQIVKVYSKEAAALRQEIAALDPVQVENRSRSSLEHAAWMVQVMLADGAIDEREMQTLRAFAGKHHIQDAQLDQLIAAVKQGTLTVPQPANNAEAQAWLDSMAEMVLADGKITPQEKQAMLNMAKKLNFSQTDIAQILRKKRSDLYQQSRAAIKSAK